MDSFSKMEEHSDKQMIKRKKKTWLPVRIIVVLLGIYSSGLVYTQRTAISVGIVAMVKNNRPDDEGGTHVCAEKNLTTTTTPTIRLVDGGQFWAPRHPNPKAAHIDTDAPTYAWDESMQGIVLGAHFWFYLFSPTLSGRLCDRFGGKWITIIGNVGSLILTLITPVVIEYVGVGGLIAVRVLMGLCHGCTFSTLFTLFVRWFPLHERASANATMSFGGALGATIMSNIAGWLSETKPGWPMIFYVNGLLYLPFLALWFIFVTDGPEENRHISDEELNYIKEHMPPVPAVPKKHKPAPWSSIFTARPVICSSIVKMCAGYGYFLLLAKIPTYLSTVFGISIMNNGMVYSAMTLGQGIVSLISGPGSNWVIQKTGARSIVIRKLFQAVAMCAPALCLAMIPVAGCNSGAVIACLMLSLCFYGCLTGGEWTTLSEYAPKNSGVVFGVTNAWAVMAGIVGPYIVGVILGDDPSNHLSRWNIVFFSTAAVFCTGALTFSILGTDERQAWDRQDDEEDEVSKDVKNGRVSISSISKDDRV